MKRIKEVILSNKALSWLLIFTNWIYQGIPQADKSEKLYKIASTILFSLIFYLSLSNSGLSVLILLLVSITFGHTLNWIVNSNLAVIIIHRIKWIKTSPIKLFNHLYSIQSRLEDKDWILLSISLGGISRGTMNVYSDIDVNVIRKPGIRNAIFALIIGTIEKKRADLYGIPLDFIVSDSIEDCIKKSCGQENPVVLYDPYNLVDKYYAEKMTLNEARKLNKIDR